MRVFLADDGAVVEERVAVQRVVGGVGQCGGVAELHTETAVFADIEDIAQMDRNRRRDGGLFVCIVNACAARASKIYRTYRHASTGADIESCVWNGEAGVEQLGSLEERLKMVAVLVVAAERATSGVEADGSKLVELIAVADGERTAQLTRGKQSLRLEVAEVVVGIDSDGDVVVVAESVVDAVAVVASIGMNALSRLQTEKQAEQRQPIDTVSESHVMICCESKR